MKVLLYFENEKLLKKSGIGRALKHQIKCAQINGISYTTNPRDTFDIAHINTYYHRSYKLAKKLKKKNVPVIVHGHSTKEDSRYSFRLWHLIQYSIAKDLKKIYSIPDIIITPTDYSKMLIENYGYVSCPVKAISNGIDLNDYASKDWSDTEISALKQQYGIKNGEKIIIGIGWFFERKGILDFMEVARSFPDIKFIWFGQRMRLLIPHKINKAIKHKPDNVILPGFVSSEVICQMLHLCECFFFPSYEETEGIVLLEALASKAVPLIRDIGVFDYLTDKVDCLKANDNEGFVQAINYILNNDMTAIKEAGYEIVKTRDINCVAKQLMEVYEEAMALKQ